MSAPYQPSSAVPEGSWSSQGLRRQDAIVQWQDWAARTIAPIDVAVLDADRFSAAWRSRSLGQIQLLHLVAPAQRVVHRGTSVGAGKAVPSIQLVYARKGVMHTHIGRSRFAVEPGEFVLLDNTRFYEMSMDSQHEAVDLMMPKGWIERWLPNWEAMLARPISARAGWGAPLGSLIEAMADDIDASPLPRQLIAEQVGALLTVATGIGDLAPSRHRGQLIQRILRRIERDFADHELTPERVAEELGISKRYLQSLLAASGTSFVQELTATRLDHASEMLADPRARRLPVGDIAYRCGFLDAGYFARQFRRRFAATPRDWRLRHLGST
jgi:AraC-like DNA-binding protein